MSGTVGDVVACTALGFTLWGACAGVGGAVLPRRAPADDGDPANDSAPADWRQVGVAACVGLGVLMFLGGIAVVLRIPWWAVTVPFLVVGLALVGLAIVGKARRPAGRALTVIGVATVVALVGVAALEAVVGFRFPLHPWDDLRAYLPLAHRLVETNGLEEAWNARRLQTVGGFTFLQAMPVALFGNLGIGVIETMLASIFLGGLFVANGLRTTTARLIGLGFVVAIPFFWVPRINTTGVLMGAPLLVAVMAIGIETRRALRAGDRGHALRWAAAGGVVVTALLSVRPNLGLLAAALVVGGMFFLAGTGSRARVETVVVAGLAALVALVPWSIASIRAVNTPFYLLSPGNQVGEAVKRPGASGPVDLLETASHLLRAGPYFWAALLALGLALICWRRLPDARYSAIAGTLTVGVILATAITGYTMGKIAFVRYTAPMSEAFAIFLFCELLRAADATAPSDASAGHVRRPRFAAVAGSALIVAISYSALGMDLEYPTAPGGGTLLARALDNDLRPRPGFEVTSPQLRTAYRRALAQVDAARTIAAVDRPYLIDTGRYDIPNMDLPGFTTPDGTFPFLDGPEAKVEYLRRQGYDTLLATVPATDVALNPVSLLLIRSQRVGAYSPIARYYLDWETDLDKLVAAAPDAVTRYGNLLVIDLRRAERELATASPGP